VYERAAQLEESRYVDRRRRLLLALSATGLFMVVEAAGGWLAGSLAILADAAHMLTDTAALAFAWLAAGVSTRGADDRRSYGYHRVQVLAGFINGLALVAIVAWIAVEAVHRFANPQPVAGGLMLGVAIAGLLVNLWVFRILHHGDDRDHGHDLNVRGAVLHVMGDLFGSAGAMVAALVILATGWTPIDPLLSLVVCVLVLVSAGRLLREAVHINGGRAVLEARRSGLSRSNVGFGRRDKEFRQINTGPAVRRAGAAMRRRRITREGERA